MLEGAGRVLEEGAVLRGVQGGRTDQGREHTGQEQLEAVPSDVCIATERYPAGQDPEPIKVSVLLLLHHFSRWAFTRTGPQ